MPEICLEIQQIRRHFLNRGSHLVNLGLLKQLEYFLKIIFLENIKHLVIKAIVDLQSQRLPAPL